MEIKELLTPEIMGSLKTLAGLAGLDILTGAMHNKIIGRVSLVLSVAKKVLSAISVISSGGVSLINQVQNYGGEIEIKTKEKANE